MITGRDFIISGMQPWDITIGSNAKDIAMEIARHNRVLYINTPVDKLNYLRHPEDANVQRIKNLRKNKGNGVRQVSSNLWVLDCPFTVYPVNSLPDGCLFDAVNKLNNRKIYNHVLSTARSIGFKDYILFIDNDIYRSFYAKNFLRPSLSVYYRRDNMVSAFWKKHAPRLEPLLCGKSDLIVANSRQLAEAVSPYNTHCYDIGQGVDLKNYQADGNYPLPEDMKDIKRPIIGYMGWITSRRLDADLMYETAKKIPECSMVLVGGEDDYFKAHKLHSLKNVFFLGAKQQAETVAYMSHFDICINPQLINEITVGNYPRKVDEYLALGKPVVATRTKTMEIFDNYVLNCLGASEYIQAIRKALQEHNPDATKRRIEFAHTHTWENSVSKLYDYIIRAQQYVTIQTKTKNQAE